MGPALHHFTAIPPPGMRRGSAAPRVPPVTRRLRLGGGEGAPTPLPSPPLPSPFVPGGGGPGQERTACPYKVPGQRVARLLPPFQVSFPESAGSPSAGLAKTSYGQLYIKILFLISPSLGPRHYGYFISIVPKPRSSGWGLSPQTRPSGRRRPRPSGRLANSAPPVARKTSSPPTIVPARRLAPKSANVRRDARSPPTPEGPAAEKAILRNHFSWGDNGYLRFCRNVTFKIRTDSYFTTNVYVK